jgi:hypothetical protein
MFSPHLFPLQSQHKSHFDIHPQRMMKKERKAKTWKHGQVPTISVATLDQSTSLKPELRSKHLTRPARHTRHFCPRSYSSPTSSNKLVSYSGAIPSHSHKPPISATPRAAICERKLRLCIFALLTQVSWRLLEISLALVRAFMVCKRMCR